MASIKAQLERAHGEFLVLVALSFSGLPDKPSDLEDRVKTCGDLVLVMGTDAADLLR